jgi:predicted TPR repeat methyltransferase
MGTPLFVSSGDLIADRRYQWALDYARRGEPAAAADILEQVVASVPGFATAWYTLGVIREQLGDRQGAVAAFRAASAADGEDYHGARLHLARLEAGETAPEMDAGFVRRLFDHYAPKFDAALVGDLSYRGPEVVTGALEQVRDAPLRFGATLDLGCGTGLAGEALRPFCERLVGVDLSPGMVEQARAKKLYDRLETADLIEFLAAETAAQYDLVIAADVFVYCSDLAPISGAVAKVMAPDGLFAFTVETGAAPGVRLQETLRYAHSDDHVRAAIAASGLELLHMKPVSTRTEKGVPVPGLVVVAGFRASTRSRSDPKSGA